MSSQGGQWVNFEAPTLQLPLDRDSYLSHNDILRLEWGVSQVRNIIEMNPLKTELGQELDPGPSVSGFDLRRWINNTVLPNAHWVGTTRMGKVDDPLAVVDESLLVKGTTNLRVVDAGVIPSAPNGNIHTTVAAVASRGAELIAQLRQDGQTDFT
jgi:choline dehydrogenase